MRFSGVLRALASVRAGRLVRELAGIRQALEDQVELQAMALGVPTPGAARAARKAEGSAGDSVKELTRISVSDDDYVQASLRRDAYEEARGAQAPFDEDFMTPPPDVPESQMVGTSVWPEDFRLMPLGPMAAPEPTPEDGK